MIFANEATVSFAKFEYFKINSDEKDAVKSIDGELYTTIDGIEKAFNVKLENNTAFLKGVVSRKKQVVPNIDNAIV